MTHATERSAVRASHIPTGLGKRCHILLNTKVAPKSLAIYCACHVDSVIAVESQSRAYVLLVRFRIRVISRGVKRMCHGRLRLCQRQMWARIFLETDACNRIGYGKFKDCARLTFGVQMRARQGPRDKSPMCATFILGYAQLVESTQHNYDFLRL